MNKKATAQKLDPVMHIGKAGVNDSVLEELRRHLKERKLIKVRILASAGETKQIAQAIADQTGAELVDVRGRTASFHVPPRP